jgi:acyl-CoA thioesterase-1
LLFAAPVEVSRLSLHGMQSNPCALAVVILSKTLESLMTLHLAHRRSGAFRCWVNRSLLVLVGFVLFLGASSLKAQQQRKQRPANPAFAKVEDNPKLPRVLLLGDSISIGYTVPVREALKGKANVHRAPANCGPTTRGLENIDAWIGDSEWDVIHFNWGLHDLKFIDGKRQVPLEKYKTNLRRLVERLEKTGATLIWCSTTPVPDGVSPPRTNDDVLAYNAAAAAIMKQHDIATDDLYAFAQPQLEKIQRKANVHFSPEGSNVLGKEVARQIQQALSKKN